MVVRSRVASTTVSGIVLLFFSDQERSPSLGLQYGGGFLPAARFPLGDGGQETTLLKQWATLELNFLYYKVE